MLFGKKISLNNANLYTLNFADDQIIKAYDFGNIEYMIRKTYRTIQEMGTRSHLEEEGGRLINERRRDLKEYQ